MWREQTLCLYIAYYSGLSLPEAVAGPAIECGERFTLVFLFTRHPSDAQETNHAITSCFHWWFQMIPTCIEWPS
jgi:hypothetical protein